MNCRLTAVVAMACLLSSCAPANTRPDSRQSLQPALADALAVPTRLPAPDASYQTLDATPLDAGGAVAFGFRNSPRVRALLARLDIAQAERIQAGLVGNPMLSLMSLRPAGGGRFELDYSLMQSLYDLFARSRRVQLADTRQRQVESEVLAGLLDVAREIEIAYYRALSAGEVLDIEQRALELEQQALALAQAQAHSGAISVKITIAQQATVSMQAHQAEAAQAEVSDARSRLALLLGLSSAKGLRLASGLPASALPDADPQTLAALATARSPDLAAARSGLDSAQAEATLESKGALRKLDPSLGLAGTREVDGMRLDGIEVQLRLPVFDRGQGRAALAAAKLRQAQSELDALEREIPLEVERSWSGLLAAEAAAGHAGHHRLQQEALERLAARTYAAGEVGFEEWLRARRDLLASERDQTQARLAACEAAIDLRRVTASASLAL